ncbi:MAG TPA: B12-binding domain-containing radical SAM protein [Geobacteraceae bacterium]
MLLINPPVTKPCEPPAGIARLAGALRNCGIPCRTWDASLEGLLWLLEQPSLADDTWSRRASRHREAHLNALRDRRTYTSPDRYTRAVRDLNRLLAIQAKSADAEVTLGDFLQEGFSPVRSSDLLAAAAAPQRNPFFPFFSRRLPELLADGTDTVGFSLTYLNQAVSTFAMMGYLRRHHPGVRIVLGGGLVTSWCQRPAWRNPFAGLVDDLVSGPGEPFLLARHGFVPDTPPAALPDYAGFPLDRYLSPGPILPYSSAGGCYWRRCSFCPETAEGNRYEPLPVPTAMAELQTLAKRHHPALLHLLDNALSPALLRALAAEPPGVPWYGFVRFTPELADPDCCRALRAAGCVMLKLGLESGDQTVLDELGKGIDLSLAATVLENLRRAGIASYVYLLFGTPAENERAARRTLHFVRHHHEAITFLNLALFNMPRESSDAASYGTGNAAADDLSLYTPFHHPAGWDRRLVRRFVNTEFSRDLLVAAILRRDPPLFTSNHAPFFSTAP